MKTATVDEPAIRWRSTRAWPVVGCVSVATCAVLLATADGYGYYRDELYFRLLADRPAWGYVDNGPATPLLARLGMAVFGDTVWALRVPCALLTAVTVVLVASLARELGGSARAQSLAAAGAAVSLFPLMIGHTLLTSTLDVPLTLLALLFAVRALRGERRWWLACGGVVGIALYNKMLILLIAFGVVVAMLLAGQRSTLRERFLWLGALLAVVIALPNLAYQIGNDWPQLDMAAGLAEETGTANRIAFLPQQLLLIGPFLTPIWLIGLVGLLRDRRWRSVRALAVGYLVCAVLFLAVGGRPDYIVPLLLVLLAAGCVRLVDARRHRAWPATALVLNGVFAVIVALPILPLRVLADTPLASVDQLFADQIGWPELAAQVTEVYRGLLAGERAHAVVLTANYGEAGAVDRFSTGLAVYSGHNQLYEYGPPPESATTVILVGIPAAAAEQAFSDCRVAARVANAAAVTNEEAGKTIQVCRGPRASWAALWPQARHLN